MTDVFSNYYGLVPVRAVDFEEENERVVLLRPRYTKGILAKWLQPLLKSKYYRVHLDSVGSATWKAVDGKKNIAQIASEIHNLFGEEVDPPQQRCTLFFRELHRSGIVNLTSGDPEATEV